MTRRARSEAASRGGAGRVEKSGAVMRAPRPARPPRPPPEARKRPPPGARTVPVATSSSTRPAAPTPANVTTPSPPARSAVRSASSTSRRASPGPGSRHRVRNAASREPWNAARDRAASPRMTWTPVPRRRTPDTAIRGARSTRRRVKPAAEAASSYSATTLRRTAAPSARHGAEGEGVDDRLVRRIRERGGEAEADERPQVGVGRRIEKGNPRDPVGQHEGCVRAAVPQTAPERLERFRDGIGPPEIGPCRRGRESAGRQVDPGERPQAEAAPGTGERRRRRLRTHRRRRPCGGDL